MCRDSQLALSVLLMLAVYVEAQSSAGWIRGTCGTSCENNFQCGFGKCENGSCTCSSDLSCQEGLCVWPQTYCGGSCGDEIGQPCTNGMNCVNSVCECVSGSKCLDNFSCNPSSTPVGETPATTVAPPAAGATTPLTPADVPTSPTAEDPEPLQPTVQPTTLPPTAQATAAGPFSTPGGRCNGLNSERRSIRTMSDAEWDAYTRAVQTLRNTPGENGVSVYENFVQTHIDQNSQAHFGAYFLPWHRQMLAAFETALNAVSPTPVSIPYWDWTNENTNFRSDSIIWNRNGGAIGNSAIPRAPYMNWNSSIQTPHTVIRGFTENTATPPNEFFVSRDNLQEWIRNGTREFATFSEYLEGVHGTVHVAIGGDMGDITLSPNDPMFFSHHAFVDKIWWDWQRTDGNGGSFGGTHGGRPASLNEMMRPWNRSVRQIIEVLSPCIRYVDSGMGSARISIPDQEIYMGIEQSFVEAKPAKIKTIPEKRRLQKKIAKKKISTPGLYKNELREALSVLNAMKNALGKFRTPQSVIDRVEKSYKVVEQKIGVDVEEAPTLSYASDEMVVKDGEMGVNALEKGNAPPGKSDDDVEFGNAPPAISSDVESIPCKSCTL